MREGRKMQITESLLRILQARCVELYERNREEYWKGVENNHQMGEYEKVHAEWDEVSQELTRCEGIYMDERGLLRHTLVHEADALYYRLDNMLADMLSEGGYNARKSDRLRYLGALAHGRAGRRMRTYYRQRDLRLKVGYPDGYGIT
jgi:hypothetical protein